MSQATNSPWPVAASARLRRARQRCLAQVFHAKNHGTIRLQGISWDLLGLTRHGDPKIFGATGYTR